jgi:chromosome segregation ATPase
MLDLRPASSKEAKPVGSLGQLVDPDSIPIEQQIEALRIDNARLSAEVNARDQEQQRLRNQLAEARKQLSDINEQACLDKIQKALREHKCALHGLPNGTCELRQKG